MAYRIIDAIYIYTFFNAFNFGKLFEMAFDITNTYIICHS